MADRRNVPTRALVALLVATGVAGCSSSTDTSWQAQKKYGTRMASRGFWREAMFRYELAAKAKPDDAEVQNNLAVACESLGETARALAAYRRALELAPENDRIKRNYARFAEYYTAVQRSGGASASPTGPTSGPGIGPSPTGFAPPPTPPPTPPPANPPR